MLPLRPVLASDADALFGLVYRSTVTDTLVWDGPDSLDDLRTALATRAEKTARKEMHLFTIVEDPSQHPIGACDIRPYQDGYRADIGIWIGAPYHNQGYGARAVRQLIHYGFAHLGLEKIEAFVFAGNHASRRIFEKNGFSLEGTLRKAQLKRGQLLDEWIFGITREEWLQNLIAHICPAAEWELAKAAGEYRAGSLENERFIHASRAEQVLQVVNAFYRNVPDLALLWIDPQLVSVPLGWDPVDGDVFPHIYGPLNTSAVVAVSPFLPDPDGVYRNLPEIKA